MNKCIFKCKQVLGKKVTGERLRLSLRVFLARQRARIFSSKKTKNSGCFTATPFAASFHLSATGPHFFFEKKRENSGWFTATPFAASFHLSATGSHFFFEKNVKTRAVFQLRHSRRVFTCSQWASIFSSKKTQKLGKY